MSLAKKDYKIINRILIISGLILFVASLEAMMSAKSIELYEAFKILSPNANQSDFINYILLNFSYNILEPILISLYTFFTYKKYGITKVYKFVFCGIILIRFIIILMKFNTGSIFYYVMVLLYFIFFLIVATTPLKKRTVKNGIF